jgi:hypothetical protein
MDNSKHLAVIMDVCEKALKTGKNLDKSNVVQILHSVMEVVETVSNLTGPEKKEIAINSMNYIVDKQDIKEEEKFELKSLINVLAPSAIDIIVNVGNGVSQLVKKSACYCF